MIAEQELRRIYHVVRRNLPAGSASIHDIAQTIIIEFSELERDRNELLEVHGELRDRLVGEYREEVKELKKQISEMQATAETWRKQAGEQIEAAEARYREAAVERDNLRLELDQAAKLISARQFRRLRRAERVVEAARTPDCNFSSERECGFLPNGTYKHHPKWCPAGRLLEAIKAYDEKEE